MHSFTFNKKMHIHNKRYVKIKLLKGVSSIINIEPWAHDDDKTSLQVNYTKLTERIVFFLGGGGGEGEGRKVQDGLFLGKKKMIKFSYKLFVALDYNRTQYPFIKGEFW